MIHLGLLCRFNMSQMTYTTTSYHSQNEIGVTYNQPFILELNILNFIALYIN